jgi:hypothetical protein
MVGRGSPSPGRLFHGRDRWFESGSLQRRVYCELGGAWRATPSSSRRSKSAAASAARCASIVGSSTPPWRSGRCPRNGSRHRRAGFPSRGHHRLHHAVLRAWSCSTWPARSPCSICRRGWRTSSGWAYDGRAARRSEPQAATAISRNSCFSHIPHSLRPAISLSGDSCRRIVRSSCRWIARNVLSSCTEVRFPIAEGTEFEPALENVRAIVEAHPRVLADPASSVLLAAQPKTRSRS